MSVCLATPRASGAYTVLCVVTALAACSMTPSAPVAPIAPVDAVADDGALQVKELPPQNAASAAGTDERQALSEYVQQIRIKLRSNIVLPPGVRGNPEAVFAVSQMPSGEIVAIRLKHSSGNARLDRALERAIARSNPLPLPALPSLFRRELELTLRPLER